MTYIKIDGFLCERCRRRWMTKQPNVTNPQNSHKRKRPYWNKRRHTATLPDSRTTHGKQSRAQTLSAHTLTMSRTQ